MLHGGFSALSWSSLACPNQGLFSSLLSKKRKRQLERTLTCAREGLKHQVITKTKYPDTTGERQSSSLFPPIIHNNFYLAKILLRKVLSGAGEIKKCRFIVSHDGCSMWLIKHSAKRHLILNLQLSGFGFWVSISTYLLLWFSQSRDMELH